MTRTDFVKNHVIKDHLNLLLFLFLTIEKLEDTQINIITELDIIVNLSNSP